ncbi:hypothetical protein GH714_022925 [Hevea brasiliensis]|uniref:Glucose-6-phosphate dehydrogenase (NADP(+)) n=1 Tax=Hevea brasiliensis TaxID=3981 RepID=A0A6A6KTV5_HEVBR|nr:hypothetical protein GH714_022925 [Hevea brasiliensis]
MEHNAPSGAPASSLRIEHVETPAEENGVQLLETEKTESSTSLSIVVVGASGDLASGKSSQHSLNFSAKIAYLRQNCNEKMDQFLKKCFCHSGQYSSEKHFMELDEKLKEKESGRSSNRLFYLAIPPSMFIDAVRCAKRSASSGNGWTRVIVEKPFGHDITSSREMTGCLKQYLTEDQIFRINHHMGEELVENLLVLRFSNLIFQPLWSRNYIRNVQFIFSEDFGTEKRGSVDLNQAKVLRSIRPVQLEDVVVGQYKDDGHGQGITSHGHPAYTDDPTVSTNSLTPTFAAATLFINNSRWDGVPFLMIAGKALHSKRMEIRVQFRHVPGNLYNRNFGTDLDKATNELVLRVQPDEAIYLKINNKRNSGCIWKVTLRCNRRREKVFIRSDELDAAWGVFTPLLKELEQKKIVPELYPYGSSGPAGVHYLAAKHSIRWENSVMTHEES